MTKLNQPNYKLPEDDLARINEMADLGEEVAVKIHNCLEECINLIKDKDNKVEDSFQYYLKGIIGTSHYQIKNRDKWNMGINSKLKNLERMDKEEINRVNTEQMKDNKVHNFVVKSFYKPVQEMLERLYKEYTGSTWVAYTNENKVSNSSIIEAKNFNQKEIDYIINLEEKLENRAS